MSLTKEIHQIKKLFLPELKWVFTKGIYVPDDNLLQSNSFSQVKYLGFRLYYDGNLFRCFGYATLALPHCISLPEDFETRKGAIAHELSHLLLDKDASERKVDDETIKRGFGYGLMMLVRKTEEFGKTRKICSYNSQELAKIVL